MDILLVSPVTEFRLKSEVEFCCAAANPTSREVNSKVVTERIVAVRSHGRKGLSLLYRISQLMSICWMKIRSKDAGVYGLSCKGEEKFDSRCGHRRTDG